MLNGAKGDTAHVKRIVLACERDMEDFTAAMDAVNVDLDEMRARVDSTHSIITSRQRVEATVTAEISTMRLDMGDMQEALKAQQPLQLALTLKDPHTGQPLSGPGGFGPAGMASMPAGPMPSPRPLTDGLSSAGMGVPSAAMGPAPPGVMGAQDQQGMQKAGGPLAKRIVRPPGPPPKA